VLGQHPANMAGGHVTVWQEEEWGWFLKWHFLISS